MYACTVCHLPFSDEPSLRLHIVAKHESVSSSRKEEAPRVSGFYEPRDFYDPEQRFFEAAGGALLLSRRERKVAEAFSKNAAQVANIIMHGKLRSLPIIETAGREWICTFGKVPERPFKARIIIFEETDLATF